MRIFLGGTCNKSTWRQKLVKMLNTYDYYNPVVADWTPECRYEELHQRELSEYVVYVITAKMIGVYSIAEVVDDSNKRKGVVLCISDHDGTFDALQMNSLHAVERLVASNGGTVCATLTSLARYLNERVVDARHS